MQPLKKNLRKFSFLFIAFSIWMWWDLSQAHSGIGSVYKSFFLNTETKASSSQLATVSIVRSNDPALANPCDVMDEGITYTTIAQIVRRAVDLAGGLNSIIKTGDTVLIKPNIISPDSSGSGRVTDVRVVKALVYLVDEIDHGHIKIIVGEGSPVPFTYFEKNSGTTATPWVQLFDVPGYQLLKTDAVNDGINFHLSNLNGNDDTNPWPELDSVNIAGGGYAQPQGGHYYIHKDVTHASVYIAVPIIKIHQQTGFTCALKDQIGLAASTRYGFVKMNGVRQENYYHKLIHYHELPYNWQDKEIVDLSISAKIKFCLVDAINCLEQKNSPVYTSDHINTHITNRVKMNTIIAGYDPVAVDNVCCRLIGLNPDDIEHITLAERAGLGTNNSDHITVAGTTIAATKMVFKKNTIVPATIDMSTYGQSNRIWLLSGSYLANDVSDPINHEFVANEASVEPTAGVGGWSQPIYFTNDQIMLNAYYGLDGSQAVVSYAFSYFNAPATQAAELWVGSDEAMKIYLNGQVVYNFTSTRTFSGTSFWSEIVPLNINQGLNTLLVKTYQGTGTTNNYNFSLNICEVQPDVNYRGNRVLGLKFTTDASSTSVRDAKTPIVKTFVLQNCYPNPFNPTTTIGYQLSKKAFVKLIIYDLVGRKVATLVNEEKPMGAYSIPWNASNFTSGVYFSKLTIGNFSQVKKMMLIK
jgi:uncharacterized protein (DUF362 family)